MRAMLTLYCASFSIAVLAVGLAVVPAVAGVSSGAAQSSASFERVNAIFGSDSSHTDSQKDRLWERDWEGECVRWTGELVDVQVDSRLFGRDRFLVYFLHDPDTFTYDVVGETDNDAWVEREVGSRWTYSATLERRSGVFLPYRVQLGC